LPELPTVHVLFAIVVTLVAIARSVLEQATLDSSRLLSAYGVVPLALHRPGRRPGLAREQVAKSVLRAGDVVLLQGHDKGLERLKRSGQVLVLDGRVDLPRQTKAALALLIADRRAEDGDCIVRGERSVGFRPQPNTPRPATKLDPWELVLWSRNALDEDYLMFTSIQSGNWGLVLSQPGDPRSFGATEHHGRDRRRHS
jgi:hypothetical protein